ncbi:hypothetical protein L2E82_10187 [Cichorium intybus]|uniref:Uncharacterized protein n=1 Tax=Cichorium intybus TaxID=13427 RepID=A0ACB9GAG1_CICIN|nr:hypothetical protein L2E82_10187 [Cichorium intybus]
MSGDFRQERGDFRRLEGARRRTFKWVDGSLERIKEAKEDRVQNVSFAEAVKGIRTCRKDSVEGNVTETNMVRSSSLKSVAIHENETLEKKEYLKEKLIGEVRVKEVESLPVGDTNGGNESFSDNKEIVEEESSEEDDWFQTSDDESVVRDPEGEFEESDGDSRIEESLFDSPSKTTHAGFENIELADDEEIVVQDTIF